MKARVLKTCVLPLWRYGSAVVRHFLRNQCPLQASALTYISLMSMVPVLALVFSISKGLNAHEKLMEALQSRITELPESTADFINRIFDFVDKTNFSTLGAIGMILMLWTAISVMSQIEGTFNGIWQIAKPRTWIRRFQAYISTLILVPVLMLAATSVTTLLTAKNVTALMREWLGPLYLPVRGGLDCAGMLSVIAGFTLLYLFMPNTRVRFAAGLFGGVISGVAWFVTQWAYIRFQIGVANAGAIYGTFAVIPLFLAWMYTSWNIILAGAVCSYVFQNRQTLLGAHAGTETLPFQGRLELALAVMLDAATASCSGAPPWNAAEFANRNRIPMRFVSDVLHVLTGHGLLAETAAGGTYLPARALHLVTPADVERALRHDPENAGKRPALLPDDSPVLQIYDRTFRQFDAGLRQASFLDLTRAAAQPAASGNEPPHEQ